MDKIKVGLIGTGAITDLHYLGYKDSNILEIEAICDTDPEILVKRSKEWGVRYYFTDYNELLSHSNIDAVEVITPHNLHAEIGKAALIAGKHVSIQKPMATTISDCDELIKIAKKSNRLLRVFENFRFYPPMVKAKELLDSGEIGEPLSIRIKVVQGHGGDNWEIPYRRWSWRFDPIKSGDGRVILDYGYHHFSLALWFMGEIEKVKAWITHTPIQNNWVIDSPSVAMWKYRGEEKYGSYEAIYSDSLYVPSKYQRPEDEWIELTGSKGLIWINRCTSELIDSPPLVMYRNGETTEFTDIDSDWGSSFIHGINDFGLAIIEKRTSTLTGEEGKDVLQFCRALQISAKENRDVDPKEIII